MVPQTLAPFRMNVGKDAYLVQVVNPRKAPGYSLRKGLVLKITSHQILVNDRLARLTKSWRSPFFFPVAQRQMVLNRIATFAAIAPRKRPL